jgi:hypothetical protein
VVRPLYFQSSAMFFGGKKIVQNGKWSRVKGQVKLCAGTDLSPPLFFPVNYKLAPGAFPLCWLHRICLSMNHICFKFKQISPANFKLFKKF